jgi:hypothetical protein
MTAASTPTMTPMYVQSDDELAVDGDATVTAGVANDVCALGDVALSVTCSSNAYVSPVVNVFAAIEHVSVAPPTAPVPPFTAHWLAGA